MPLGFQCLNLWYAKSFHQNVMKFTAFTEHDLGVLSMKFLSNQSTLPIQYNFYIELIPRVFKTFSRCSLIYQVYAFYIFLFFNNEH